MGWMQTLAETYDKCKSEVGDKKTSVYQRLLPIKHEIRKIQIEIYLDDKGNILDAVRLGNEEMDTIVPISLKQKTSKAIVPQPLEDEIIYCAGDNYKYLKEINAERRKNNKKTDLTEDELKSCFQEYILNLEKWATWGNVHEDIKIIYKYLTKSKLINDLKNKEVFKSFKDRVRFVVKYNNKELVVKNYENNEVYDNYIQYSKIGNDKQGIDFVTGKNDYLIKHHPKFIRTSGDGAKLISLDDKDGYTYRGRFLNADEAVTISVESSLKAHNVLKWLIRKQKIENDSEVILLFNIDTKTEIKNPFDDELFIDIKNGIDTEEMYAKNVKKVIEGKVERDYALDVLSKHRKVVAISLDNLSKGRLAITYYNEFDKIALIDNIKKWYIECSWIRIKNNKRIIWTPNIDRIIKTIYMFDNNRLSNGDKKLMKIIKHRIFCCLIEHKRLPKDIFITAINCLNNPYRLIKVNKQFEDALCVICALIKLYYNKKEEIKMALDKEKIDRSYLFGRLLAVYDYIEEKAKSSNKVKNESQAKPRKAYTSAIKLWNSFVRNPAKIVPMLKQNSNYYCKKISLGLAKKCENEILQIMNMLSENKLYNNKQLNEQYILGYYMQKLDLKSYNKSSSLKEENENE